MLMQKNALKLLARLHGSQARMDVRFSPIQVSQTKAGH